MFNRMKQGSVQIHGSWKRELLNEFSKPYMQGLREFLRQESKSKKIIYPKSTEFFAAFNRTPLDRVKVVIIGQDPYHGPGQAHGLSFSVRPGVSIPPSLKNIYKEMNQDLGLDLPNHGFLESWAEQGVFLLNATLSVEARKAGSHHNKGWEGFTSATIDILNKKKRNIVFLLWGNYAQKKGAQIDLQKHFVLKAPHPSPLSAHRGFFGCRHFSQTNQYLLGKNLTPIDWQLPSL